MRKLHWTEEQYVYGEVMRRRDERWNCFLEKPTTVLTIEKTVRKEILKNTVAKNMYNSLKKLPDFDEKCLRFIFYNYATGEGEMSYDKSPFYVLIKIPMSTQFRHMWATFRKAEGNEMPRNFMAKYSILFASWKGTNEERPKKIEELIDFIYKDYFEPIELELKQELKNLK